MSDYTDLVEYLREMHDVMLYDDSIESGTPEEMITDIDAIACKEAADAIEQLVKERDALLCDFLEGYKDQVEHGHGIYRCDICKHGIENTNNNSCQKKNCNGFSNWEWRGVQEDNDGLS